MFSLIERIKHRKQLFAAGTLLLTLVFSNSAQAQTSSNDDISFLIPVIQLLLLDESIPRTPQTELSLDNSTAEIFVGGTFTNTVSGGDGTGALVFSSQNQAIATVDRNTGEVLGIAAGQAVISVFKRGDRFFLNGDPVTFTITVNQKLAQDPLVPAAPAVEVAINATVNNIVSGGSGTGALSFSSSDTDIATVDALSGVVTGVAAGSVTITVAKAGDAMFQAATEVTYQVTVVKLAQAALSFAQTDLSVEVGAAISQLAVGGSGTGAISYSSSNTDFATVDPATGQVTGIAVGQVIISAMRAGDAEFLDSAPATYAINVTEAVTPDCVWDSTNWDECNWQ